MTIDHRPWGSYQIIYESEKTKVKVITVSPTHRLSYQSHENRSEHWVVLSGLSNVTLDGHQKTYGPGEHIHIPATVKHRIENPGPSNLIFVEIQTGSSFDEGDIIRYDDDYGRAN